MSIDLIAHAMRLSEELGAPVFPVRVEPDPAIPGKTTKRPLVAGWQNGGARIRRLSPQLRRQHCT